MLRRTVDIYERHGQTNGPIMAQALRNLGVALEREAKLSEAESIYSKALAIERKLVADRPELHLGRNILVVYGFEDLIRILEREEKSEEAQALRREALESLRKAAGVLALQKSPQNPDLLWFRGEIFAHLGRWKEAAADLLGLRELRPSDDLAWQTLAAVLVENGDVESYPEHCRKGIALFGNTLDPAIGYRLASGCLMLPSSGVEIGIIHEITDKALATARGRPSLLLASLTSIEFCKGLNEYRENHFADAAQWMRKVLSRSGDPTAPRPIRLATGDSLGRDVAAYAVLAMACYRSKQADEAQANLVKGSELMEKLPRLGSSDLGENPVDWVIADALMREAKGLIEGQSPKGEVQSPTPFVKSTAEFKNSKVQSRLEVPAGPQPVAGSNQPKSE
jgi:tetratricopeptide (TPR) repeat protein